MQLKGFVGPSYTLKSVNADAQRCVNLYAEMNEMGLGKESGVAYLRGTPGLEQLLTVGLGPIRLVHFDDTPVHPLNPVTRVLVVSGSELYKVLFTAGSWVATKLGNLNTSTGVVRAHSLDINLGITVFVDGIDTYLYWKYEAGPVFEDFGTFASFGYPQVVKPTHVISIDGYLIYNSAGTNQFYVSDLNSFNVNPLSYASAEGDPDFIVGMIANRRDLWLFNERTTEVFVNTGNADFPFERSSGGFIQVGCLAKHSISLIDSTILWLARDRQGQGMVYAAGGLVPQRISTHAVETAIKSYANPSAAVAYTYQNEGHSFYVLNFAEATWVYDLSTRLWHERAYTNAGTLERHRAQYCSFIPQFGFHMVGDYANNKIYKLNEDYYSDAGAEITRLRASPHISSGLKRVFYNSFQVDMETGVGLITGQGSDPQVVMTFSDDGGHTWSNEAWASAGQATGMIGQFKKRVIWRRLGSARDRIFQIKITDPVKVAILGAEIDVQSGVS